MTSLAATYTGSLLGVEAEIIEVEVHVHRGIPAFDLVGLAEAAVKESRVRVRAALSNCGCELPNKHVIVNLAPADVRKRGCVFDLAIAVAVLAVTDVVPMTSLAETFFAGELALSGEIRDVRGILSLLLAARKAGFKRAIVPRACESEATLVPGIEVRLAGHLEQVIEALSGKSELPLARAPDWQHARDGELDFCEVRGQEHAKRAFEIAAAGFHNILMVGPPGAGKTMLASRLPGILPSPTDAERLTIATIASAAGLSAMDAAKTRPFRAPHHSASAPALIGGGDPIQPGEVTLAHGGVLFLDELPEFDRRAIESLRTTMESGRAVVARVRERIAMPASPLVVAAMNPCPCGYAGDKKRECVCSPQRIESYRSRVSGPLVDRFDIHLALAPVELEDLRKPHAIANSREIRTRVDQARARVLEGGVGSLDQSLELLSERARRLLEVSAVRLGLSMRGFGKVLRVARTISILGGQAGVDEAHIAEALQYRVLDRKPRDDGHSRKSLVGRA